MSKLYILKADIDNFRMGDLFIKIAEEYYRLHRVEILDGKKVAKYPGNKLPIEYASYLYEVGLINELNPNPNKTRYLEVADFKELIRQLRYVDAVNYDDSLHNSAVSELKSFLDN
jgi:hypothetical protein